MGGFVSLCPSTGGFSECSLPLDCSKGQQRIFTFIAEPPSEERQYLQRFLWLVTFGRLLLSSPFHTLRAVVMGVVLASRALLF
ncbi:hypothetical protein AOLI_G00243380 [Acnodon oligacanthus]